MSTTTPQPWPIAITQANALYLAVLCGSWICAGVAGWWLSVPIPVSDSAYVLPMFVHGMIASIVMSFIWLHVTGLETWQVAVRRGIWIIVSSAPVFFLATTRGSTCFPEVWQIWRAVIVDNHASAQRLTTNHWWCLAFVQCLVCVSLWMCTLPLWKQLRWHREHPLARQSWLPNLILGCSGLVIVSMIQGFINYQYRYPRFGPTAVKELAEHSLNAAVFSFLFPAPLLLLKSERGWSIVTFFGLIIALSLGLWFADAQGRLGVFGGYSSWYQLRDALPGSVHRRGLTDPRSPHVPPVPRIAPTHPAFAGDDHCHWAPCRKALAAEFEIQGRRLFVIVCHFKSMRSTTRREEDYAKKQRHAQAEIVHHFAADLLACDPQAAIVLLGDLNDVPGSKTLKLLKGEAFHSLLEDLPRGQAYTRRHGGQPQALDHILVSPVLRRGATARIPHSNSDAAPGEPEPASDHDPVAATLPALLGA